MKGNLMFNKIRKVKEKGLAKNIGVSNFTIEHLEEAQEQSSVPITNNQVEFHPYLNQKKLLDYCQKQDIVVTAYSPLARGEIFADEEIQKLQTELISQREYEKLQNKFENRFVNSNSSVSGIASSLATYQMLYGDTDLINKEIEIYRSITREEIRDVAKKYLNPNQRVELEYLPKKDSE